MNVQGRIFTTENLALMRQMAAQGCSAREIAHAIGSTPSSVRVKCSYQKIRLKRGRRRPNELLPPLRSDCARQPGDYVRHSVVSYLPASVFTEFNRKANEMNLSTSALASALLNMVATSDLYKAVLDD
jgi:hypothetical protein